MVGALWSQSAQSSLVTTVSTATRGADESRRYILEKSKVPVHTQQISFESWRNVHVQSLSMTWHDMTYWHIYYTCFFRHWSELYYTVQWALTVHLLENTNIPIFMNDNELAMMSCLLCCLDDMCAVCWGQMWVLDRDPGLWLVETNFPAFWLVNTRPRTDYRVEPPHTALWKIQRDQEDIHFMS